MNMWRSAGLLLLAVSALSVGATNLSAQEPATIEIPPELMDALQQDIATLHQDVMQQSIQLEPGQAGAFWEIYDDYLDEVRALTAERTELLRDFALAYDTMSDDQARAMGRRALEFERRRHEAVEEYFVRIGDDVGGRAAGQFLQIEHRIQMLKDLRLAIEIPLIG